MLRRYSRILEVVFQLRSGLQQYRRHAESLSYEFQQSQAELRQIFRTSNTEGARFGFFCDRDQNCEHQTRSRRPTVPPESLQCETNRRIDKDSCGISSRRMLGFRALMNQVQITNRFDEHKKSGNWRSNCRRQPSNSVANFHRKKSIYRTSRTQKIL